MFHDRATIHVSGGSGGDGAVSFRREAHVPKGGPDGGDGGRGGEVILVCDASRRDLAEFHRGGHFRAPRGGHGEGSQRHGADGESVEVRVPPGTAAEDAERGVRWDLVASGQRAVVARGGGGGRGNKSFATSTRQTPRMSERGLAGEEGVLRLSLRLLADAGLVGVPNAGKSSLLGRMTAARPRVAAYPFTTLEPVLGAIEADDRQLVVADIPGLIEGASQGAGLGHEFLAHVERCRLLVHVVDPAPADGSDPEANHATVEAELAEHGHGLAGLPRILCLSKADLVPAEELEGLADSWRARLGDSVLDVVVTSSATGQGVDDLRRMLVRAVPAEEELAGEGPPVEVEASHRVFRPGADQAFEVTRTPTGAYRVEGRRLEELFARHDLENDESLRYLEDRLRSMGVIRTLQAAGFEPGDEVEIAGVVFELDPARRYADAPMRAAVPICAAALAATLLGGCGGNDKADAQGVVEGFAKAVDTRDGSTFCTKLVTRSYLEQVTEATGKSAVGQCEQQMRSEQQPRFRVVKFTKTEVHGDTATVTAELEAHGQRHPQLFHLKKQDGSFRLTTDQSQ